MFKFKILKKVTVIFTCVACLLVINSVALRHHRLSQGYKGSSRIKNVTWSEMVVYFEKDQGDKSSYDVVNITNLEKLNEFRSILTIKDSSFLPTISESTSAKIFIKLQNGETFVMIAEMSSVSSSSHPFNNVVCYNKNNEIESYRLVINISFLISIHDYLQTQVKEGIVCLGVASILRRSFVKLGKSHRNKT